MKGLLFIAAAMIVTTASAQMKPAYQNKVADAKEKLTQLQQHAPAHQLDLSKVTTMQKMQMGKVSNSNYVSKAPQKEGRLRPWYRRPAGMFCSPLIAEHGKGFYSYGNIVFLLKKPFAEYTWVGFIDGADENTHCAWDVWSWGDVFYGVDDQMSIKLGDITEAPIFYAVDGELEDPAADWYDYQMKSYNDDGTPCPVRILSIVKSEDYEEGIDFLCTSKTMLNGGRYGNVDGMFSRYYGAEPWGDNQYGWWFGKNGSKVDGMAMAFEKPEHPYLLTKVYLQAYTDMVVTAPVEMKCKIYKLDEIPAYINDNLTSAILPAEPGTLVCTGKAIITPTTGEDKNGLIEFTLYGHDEYDPELVYEYNPTIDYPILVCVEGYNDEGMENLVDFSAFCSTDNQVDEGYGELAYLKEGIFEVSLDQNGDTIFDENGDPVRYFTGEYRWRGLNNRFMARDDEEWPEKRATMKTGLTLFIGIENPFIIFNYDVEDGYYTFPIEGGEFEKTFEFSDTTIVCDAIEFFSYNASEDWEITWNGSDELPDWLEVELEDEVDESGEFSGLVLGHVTCAPLPYDDGVFGRSAVIRFSIPGAYVDYKFTQYICGLEEELINTDAVPVGYYDVTGRQLSGMQQGINIVKMSDGTARKIYIK